MAEYIDRWTNRGILEWQIDRNCVQVHNMHDALVSLYRHRSVPGKFLIILVGDD